MPAVPRTALDFDITTQLGRPPVEYDPEVGNLVAHYIAAGYSLTRIAGTKLDPNDPNSRTIPSRTVLVAWALDETHPFSFVYSRARDIWAENEAMICTEIADEVARMRDPSSAQVQAAKLRIDTRHWNAQRLLRHRYAERLELTGANGQPITVLTTNYAPADKVGADKVLDGTAYKVEPPALAADNHAQDPDDPAN